MRLSAMPEPWGETVELPREIPTNWISGIEFSVALVIVLAAWRWLMKGDIATAWTKIKANREKEKAQAAEDIATLRGQIDADGIDDADRAAIAEMQAEAAQS